MKEVNVMTKGLVTMIALLGCGMGMMAGCSATNAADAATSEDLARSASAGVPEGQYELDLASRVCSKATTPLDVRQPTFGQGQRQFFRFRDGSSPSFDFRAYHPDDATCWAQVTGPYEVDGDTLHVTSQSHATSCGAGIALASSHLLSWTDGTQHSFRLASSASEIGHGVCPQGLPWLLTTWVASPTTE
jgi:hypothetical protein